MGESTLSSLSAVVPLLWMTKYAATVGALGGNSWDHGWAISSSPALYW
jgi:hypothetical protein